MGLPGPDRHRLAGLEPKIALLTPATLVWRVYRSAGAHPCRWNDLRHFGPVPSRFDHHLEGPDGEPCEQERGVLYAAPDFLTCVAETFQAGRHVDAGTDGLRVATFHVGEPVPLLDLTGRFATLAGCHQGIHSSPLRRRTRALARAFYDTWPDVQGLLFRSKMAVNLPAYVLSERAAHALPRSPLVDLPLTDLRLATALRWIARELGYTFG
jgi:hypothetical protein